MLFNGARGKRYARKFDRPNKNKVREMLFIDTSKLISRFCCSFIVSLQNCSNSFFKITFLNNVFASARAIIFSL